MPLHIVLYQPEIPPNTGNVIRLAANTGSTLTLVAPLGFELVDSKLKRAGLDYREWADMRVCNSLDAALKPFNLNRVFAFTTKAGQTYTDIEYQQGDVLLFGPETRGLPAHVREEFNERCVRIPMLSNSRSLNLANSVAVAVYEAWRQLGYDGFS
ncbi:MAG: tRNA (cytidine(34)-2'-O)-methyltransferase [Gammaproteobacteria bacterium]|nr:tRNA (cytidine(34)-2'-O)-methyltransferase [Gammaproteobacteria bacterium]